MNLGLKFCVVCGRHVTHESMGKLGGGLRSGFRPADITRRLDELITVARFRRSRRSHELEKKGRFVFMNTAYLFIAAGLFYAAIQFSLETLFPGKFQDSRIPIDKIIGFVKDKANQVAPLVKPDATPAAAVSPTPNPEKAVASKAPIEAKSSKPAKQSKKKKRARKTRAKQSE